MPGLKPRVVVVAPTYDERGNVAELVERVLGLGVPGLELLVVDDESPDGTAELVAELARARPALRLLRRRPPAGRGLAGRDGFLAALERGAGFIVEMDADLSHPPESIPALLAAMDSCDVALGSRFVPGGGDRERGPGRRALSLAAAAFTRAVLGVPVRDANSGFRCFSREALLAVEPATLRSTGPEIIQETLFRAAAVGLRLREVAYPFADRRAGASKLGPGRLAACWRQALRLRLGGG